jgi:hypothetical protein
MDLEKELKQLKLELSEIKHDNTILVKGLKKISELSLAKISDYKHGYEKTREIARETLTTYMEKY